MEIHKGRRIIILTVVILLLLGTILVILDWHDINRLVGEADWKLTLVSLLFITVTYFCLSYGFVIVSRIFGVNAKQREILKIGYVSATVNNLLAFLGAAGHSLRIILMKRQGVAAGQTIAISLFHSHFHNLVMFCLLPIGLSYLLIHHSMQGSSVISLGLATGILTLLVVMATVIVFARSLRLAILRILTRIVRIFIRKDVGTFFDKFDETMSLGVSLIRNRPLVLVLALAFIIAEWLFTLGALWFCFDALGNPLSPGVLITGFAIGITAGNLSMVPGGLGVQEASMAGVYALLGISFERAVLASILFRVVYDFVPFIVSVFFYRGLLKESERAVISS